MTAPRKPVAWTDQQSLDDLLADRVSGVQMGSHSERYGRTVPLYTAPDLQPLWALVERWNKEAILHSNTCMSDGTAGAYETCADELHTALEAMQ